MKTALEYPRSEEDIHCPLCSKKMQWSWGGNYTRQNIKSYLFSIYYCESCDFSRTYPFVSNEVYMATRSKDDPNKFEPHIFGKAHELLVNRIRKERKSGSLLDLGCNEGHLIKLLSPYDYECFGVEIDQDSAQRGIDAGLPIIQEDFLNYDFKQEYDIIVMNHVLEHIPQLDPIPKRIAELVKSDGVVFINIPHLDGIIPRIMKHKWSILAPYTHLWFFSKKSIYNYFKDHFQDITLYTNTTAEPIGWHWKEPKTIIKTIIAKIGMLFGQGDELRIVLRNPIKN